MKRNIEDDLKIALRLADLSDVICLKNFKKNIFVKNKIDGSPVSNVDNEIENLFKKKLKQFRPNDLFYGEETGTNLNIINEGAVWLIDPLDHTRHFVRGIEEYGTLISLLIDGFPVLGVISAPSLGLRWYGAKNFGSFRNNIKISVSKINVLQKSYIGYAGFFEWQNSKIKFEQLLKNTLYNYGSPGGFLTPMLVANGSLDIFIEPWGEIWDHCATVAIIEGAGGKASKIDGTLPNGNSLLVTNGTIHDIVLELLNN